MPQDFADAVEKALELETQHDAGREQSNRDLHRKKLDNGKLEIRLRLLEMRQSYLIQMNTQAALVGGCAVALLASGELTIIHDLSICDHGLLGLPVFCQIYDAFLSIWYISSAFGCFAVSISVIYTSVNLVNMGTLLVVHEHRGDALDELNTMIEHRMDRVRKMFLLSLNCLLMAVCAMIAEVLPYIFYLIAAPMTVVVARNAFDDDRRLLDNFSNSEDHAEMFESLLAERWTKREILEWLRATLRRCLAKAIVLAKAPRILHTHPHHGVGKDAEGWSRVIEELNGAVREEVETVAAQEAAIAEQEAAAAAALAAENDDGAAAVAPPVRPGMFSAHALHALHVGAHALHHEGSTWRFVAVPLASAEGSAGGGGGGNAGGAVGGVSPRGAQRACSSFRKPLGTPLARAPCKGPLSIAIAAPGQEGAGGGGGGQALPAWVHIEFERLWAEVGVRSLLHTGAAAERGVLYAFATHLDTAGHDHHDARPCARIRLRDCTIEMLRRSRVDESGQSVRAPAATTQPPEGVVAASTASGELCFRLAPASDASTAGTWYVKGVDEPTTRHWFEVLVAHGTRQIVSRAPLCRRLGRATTISFALPQA